MPASMQKIGAQRLTPNDALLYLSAVKQTLKDEKHKYKGFMKVLKRFQAQRIDVAHAIARLKDLFEGHPQLLKGFNTFLPEWCKISFLEEEPSFLLQEIPLKLVKAINYVNKIKTCFEHDKHIFRAFLWILKMYGEGTMLINEVYSKVASLFTYHSDLLEEFKDLLTDLTDSMVSTSHATTSKPLIFVKTEDQKLMMVVAENYNNDRVAEEVADALGKHPVLLKYLTELLSLRGSPGFVETIEATVPVEKDKDRHENQNTEFDRKLVEVGKRQWEMGEETQKNRKTNRYSLRSVKDRHENQDREIDRKLVEDKKRHWEMEEERQKKSKANGDRDVLSQNVSVLSDQENTDKHITRLDLTHRERCTPSYCLVSKNYPRPLSTHRTELDSAVLNDSWVSVMSGSVDYSCNPSEKNQCEEILFRCEDDQFELDMVLEISSVTVKRVKEIIDCRLDQSIPEHPFCVDEHLSAMHLRCIERIYGKHGLEIIDLINKDPAVALPVVHDRLIEKHEEWLKFRAGMGKIWTEVYIRNFLGSLEHQSCTSGSKIRPLPVAYKSKKKQKNTHCTKGKSENTL
ncbi:hypothetical protein O6H91_06G038400 [Diphasiastrum complanatum]|uniref:Uncharacterized protein n=1 Tax=Diphasiastrum complanatum TaxID=34168 RepID=A0ACC2DCR1_DIPCM|nr:hypothetical protein O6H91_06G038400 [Diphasiastrum complanatum]